MNVGHLSIPEEWLALALRAADLGAWYWDLDDPEEIIVRTENYDRMWGLKPGDSWTRSEMLKHVHDQDRERLADLVQSVVDGKQPGWETEYRLIGDDGKLHWVQSRAKGLRGSDGRVRQVAGVSRDITQEKALRRAHEQFVMTLTHDIRNPLSTARANCELLKDFGANIKDRKVRLDRAIRAIDRTDRIIQDLLDASHAEAGHEIEISFRECDLSDLFRETVADLSIQYGDRFRLEIPRKSVGLWPTDAIRRIVENLASNAIKYGTRDEPVVIRLGVDGDRAIVSVHNNGTPICAEDQKHLFEPFYRTKAARERERGLGLGLTLVKWLTSAIRGEVRVESSPDQGTTFIAEFPKPLSADALSERTG